MPCPEKKKSNPGSHRGARGTSDYVPGQRPTSYRKGVKKQRKINVGRFVDKRRNL